MLKPVLLGAVMLAVAVDCAIAQQREVKIGFVTTLSGGPAAVGNDMRDAFELALDHLGRKMSGLAVQVIYEDDGLKPELGKQKTDRLIESEKVNFLTGYMMSHILLASIKSAVDSSTFLISANAGPSQIAGELCSPWFFSSSWQGDQVPQAIGEYMNQKNVKTAYLIAPNYPGGRETLNGFKRFYKGKIADEVYVKLGQLDYAAEIANIRAAKPDAVFFFLPGGMGINFVKQYVAAGADKDAKLFTPGFSADEDTIKAVGEPMIGILNTSQWSADLDNPANKKFVQEFQKEYGRLPTMYASQAYDVALLIDAAVKQIGGKVEDKEALRKALSEAKFDATRGKFRFNKNNFPIQDYYLREVYRDASGRITNKTVGKVFSDFQDVHAAKCKMK